MKGTGIALLVVAIVLGLGGVGCGNVPEEAVGVTTTAAPSAAQNDGPSQQAPKVRGPTPRREPPAAPIAPGVSRSPIPVPTP